jgi:hypothetical protein
VPPPIRSGVMVYLRPIEMLQAWGIASQPGLKRTQSDVEGGKEPDIKPAFINLDSDEEEEEVNSN